MQIISGSVTEAFGPGGQRRLLERELITEQGIGNGISILIFAGIISQIPQMLGSLISSLGNTSAGGLNVFNWFTLPVNPTVFWLVVIMAIASLIVLYFLVKINEAQRVITINYAKRIHAKYILLNKTPEKNNMPYSFRKYISLTNSDNKDLVLRYNADEKKMPIHIDAYIKNFPFDLEAQNQKGIYVFTTMENLEKFIEEYGQDKADPTNLCKLCQFLQFKDSIKIKCGGFQKCFQNSPYFG